MWTWIKTKLITSYIKGWANRLPDLASDRARQVVGEMSTLTLLASEQLEDGEWTVGEREAFVSSLVESVCKIMGL